MTPIRTDDRGTGRAALFPWGMAYNPVSNAYVVTDYFNYQVRQYGADWAFDKTEGIKQGNALADHVFNNFLRPVPGRMTAVKRPRLDRQRELLGITPRVSLEDGVERVCRRVRERLRDLEAARA